MSTQTEVQSTSESSGIAGADEFATRARALGLNAEVKRTRVEAATDGDGNVMLPAVLAVSVIVKMTVPETMQANVLALMERHTTLTSYWTLKDKPRARGRWVQASYSTLGGHEDLHVMHRAYAKLELMASDMERLQRLAAS